jgi:hypothetical protein
MTRSDRSVRGCAPKEYQTAVINDDGGARSNQGNRRGPVPRRPALDSRSEAGGYLWMTMFPPVAMVLGPRLSGTVGSLS